MNECPRCFNLINYAPPCEICRRAIAKEYEARAGVPGEERGKSPLDPSFFNIPGSNEPYTP